MKRRIQIANPGLDVVRQTNPNMELAGILPLEHRKIIRPAMAVPARSSALFRVDASPQLIGVGI